MKVFKQTSPALLAMLAIISILPGCGKGNGSAATGGGVAATYANATLQGSCYNFYSTPMGQGATLTFQGQGYINAGWLQSGQQPIQGAAVGFPGAQYTRTNVAGDTVSVYLSGYTIIAQATLAPQTVQYFQARGQSVCGLGFNTSITGNQLLYSTYVYVGSGYGGGGGWSQITL